MIGGASGEVLANLVSDAAVLPGVLLACDDLSAITARQQLSRQPEIVLEQSPFCERPTEVRWRILQSIAGFPTLEGLDAIRLTSGNHAKMPDGTPLTIQSADPDILFAPPENGYPELIPEHVHNAIQETVGVIRHIAGLASSLRIELLLDNIADPQPIATTVLVNIPDNEHAAAYQSSLEAAGGLLIGGERLATHDRVAGSDYTLFTPDTSQIITFNANDHRPESIAARLQARQDFMASRERA